MGFLQIWAEMDPFWDQILGQIEDFTQDFGQKMFPVPFFTYSLGATGPK